MAMIGGGIPYQNPYGGDPYANGGVDYTGGAAGLGTQPPSPFSNNGNDLANYIKGTVNQSISNNNAQGGGTTVNGQQQQPTTTIIREDDDDD